MKNFKTLSILLVFLTSLSFVHSPAQALPLASYSVNAEYSQSDSSWLYDLSVTNDSAPGYDLYWLVIVLPQDSLFKWQLLPTGWTGYPDPQFSDLTRSATLTADFGYELPGGLGDSMKLSFTVDSQLTGDLQFTPFFTEPAQTMPVPEPSTWLLLTAGLGGFVLLRRRSR